MLRGDWFLLKGDWFLFLFMSFFMAFESKVLGKLLVFWFCAVSSLIIFFHIPSISWILVIVTTYFMIWMAFLFLCILVMTEESDS
ncbi:hypothetical protein A2996_01945 [Candidatus Campbellbacteria bacterium RIFCSPLOWO2_01_FULL_34_15]|uniref:Uncharacterized protein n=2 Tax=Candidatus Campbelliibacteriota TaxID=1752727 RepID=A0A1F5EPY2_9BACT|nr:MAG: hypothetical protein A2811_00325 [Candidatus Campbellbacteria bacterium RIFCSPHIGHO2_01_FULL_34_10]OGD69443.1 MAG: hypothetical protein A2996_01945 [Candidatus Campbellbacteria bacterium RIFCSPLOWO2_01_FULL_34_15]